MKWKQARCESGGCVQVAAVGGQIALRSTERPGVVLLDRQEWDAFLAGVKAGDFNELPAAGQKDGARHA